MKRTPEKPPRVVWQIEWNSPYTKPPDGEPDVLALLILPRGQRPTVLEMLCKPGNGYCIAWKGLLDRKPPRKLSETAKQGIRRKNLSRRANRKAPLFADQWIKEELTAKPEYFGNAIDKPKQL